MEQIELIDEFRKDLKAREASFDTIRVYPGSVKALYKFNNGDLLGVNEEILSAYIVYMREDLKLKAKSISRHFNALSTFYKFLVWKKYILTNPVTAVREHYLRSYKSHNTTQRRQCPTIEQVSLLVGSIYDRRDKAILTLLFKTGIRRKELSELDAMDA